MKSDRLLAREMAALAAGVPLAVVVMVVMVVMRVPILEELAVLRALPVLERLVHLEELVVIVPAMGRLEVALEVVVEKEDRVDHRAGAGVMAGFWLPGI